MSPLAALAGLIVIAGLVTLAVGETIIGIVLIVLGLIVGIGGRKPRSHGYMNPGNH